MKARLLLAVFVCILLMFMNLGCVTTKCCKVQTKTITIYEDHTIPANMGISTGVYTDVDGYRYVDIAVEFEQKTSDEEPVSRLPIMGPFLQVFPFNHHNKERKFSIVLYLTN
jgi:hypothetical protein